MNHIELLPQLKYSYHFILTFFGVVRLQKPTKRLNVVKPSLGVLVKKDAFNQLQRLLKKESYGPLSTTGHTLTGTNFSFLSYPKTSAFLWGSSKYSRFWYALSARETVATLETFVLWP